MDINFLKKKILIFLAASLMVFAPIVHSEVPKEPVSVEINGDNVEYSVDGNKVIAKGNVVIIRGDSKLTADTVDFSRTTNLAHAKGHVRLIMKQGEIKGDEVTFNFETMTGDFHGAKIFADPYYGAGEDIVKVSDKKMELKRGYLTTCDLDKPHFHLFAPKVDIYPQDKIVARNIRLVIGSVPVFYIPRMTQRLDDKKPWFTFVPGYKKDWGMFLLTQSRYYINDHLQGVVHVDGREKKSVAWGVDAKYKTDSYGDGIIRTYYMNELTMDRKRFWQPKINKTIARERFKSEWRHKWDIDKKTNLILQYYKLSDSSILKDYFNKEYQKDSSPRTFMTLTKSFPQGVLSFQLEGRVNNFESKTVRLPEIRYDLSSVKVGDTGFFIQNTSSFANLASKSPSPTEVRLETKRLDTDNELSYPMKVWIFEMQPFIGERFTYYSKTKDPDEYNSIRGIFRTGAMLSTKFYRIYEVESHFLGGEIKNLRHIITPTVLYKYQRDPTRTSDQLDIFDSIDSMTRIHSINFGLENKFQTKRKGTSVDLFRVLVSTDFRLKENPGTGGFDQVKADMDFKPVDWLTLYFDSNYDTRHDRLSTANFDLYINGGKKWTLGFGKRLERNVDDQVTAQIEYKFNPKWKIKVYERFDTEHGTQKEQSFTVTRDLHEWDLDMLYSEKRGSGSEILLVFTLKAFPEIGFDLGSGFNKRKAGSQTGE